MMASLETANIKKKPMTTACSGFSVPNEAAAVANP
jgi:hypothetical protein